MDRIKWILLALLVIIIGIAAGLVFGSYKFKNQQLGSKSEYQAVFLSNGQVYFGKLADDNGNWVTLSDIYYLQTKQNEPLQQGTTGTGQAGQQSDVQLVKLGSELHGPEDVMHIERDKILFWENMTDSSKVVQTIKSQSKK